MIIKRRAYFDETLMFFGVTALMFFANTINLIFMSGLTTTQSTGLTGFFIFGITYSLVFLLIALAMLTQSNKIFRFSWMVPLLYLSLSIWAIFNSDGGHGQNINGTLGFISKPLVGIACMLIYEYMFSLHDAAKWRKLTDYLQLYILLLGVLMVILQLVNSLAHPNVRGEFLAVNNIYFILPLSSYWMIRLTQKRWWLIPAIAGFLSMIALKRGAIIATIVMFLFSEATRRKLTDIPRFFFNVAFILSLFYISFYFLDKELFNGFLTYRFETIAEGSGRSIQLRWALDVISKLPFDSLLFGHGLDASDIRFNLFIHNDWLRIIFDFGLIGLSLYMAIYVYFIAVAIRLKKHNSPYTSAWVANMLFCICLSFYSSVTWVYIFNVLPIQGCILGLERKRKQILAMHTHQHIPKYI